MSEIYRIKDISQFNPEIPVYIDSNVKKKILYSDFTNEETLGFLVGDLREYEQQRYVLITDAITTVDEIDEKIDDSKMIVGSYFQEGTLDEHLSKLPYGLEKKNYYTLMRCSLSKESEEIDFEVFISGEEGYSEVDFRIFPLSKLERELDDEIYIQEEMAVFRQSEKLLSFLLLSAVAIFFGVFGGILGFLLSADQVKERRISLLLIGIISSLVWFILPYIP